MAIIATQTAERDPGPYPARRRCKRCDCYLSRSNPAKVCSPCQGPVARDQARLLIRELMEEAR